MEVQAKFYYLWELPWWVIISVVAIAAIVLVVAILMGRRSN